MQFKICPRPENIFLWSIFLTLAEKNVYAPRAFTMTEHLKYGARAQVYQNICFPDTCVCVSVVVGRSGLTRIA